MKRRQKDPPQRTRGRSSQNSIECYASDIDDMESLDTGSDDDKHSFSSEPIESFSDDANTNDEDPFNNSSIESIHDDFDDANATTNTSTRQRISKPFSALEGLDLWRPDSSSKFNNSSSTNGDLSSEDDDDDDNDDRYNGDTRESDQLKDESGNTILGNALAIRRNTSTPSISPSFSSNEILTDDDSISRNDIDRKINKNDTSKQQQQQQQQSSHPAFSLYQQVHREDTSPSFHVQQPSFIFDHTTTNDTNNRHLPIKSDGLAATALQCIEQEQTAFRQWRSSVLIEMAKHGTVAQSCQQDSKVRLCRLLDLWMEHGCLFGWCVDLTMDEHRILLKHQQKYTLDSVQDLDTIDDDDDYWLDRDLGTEAEEKKAAAFDPSLPSYQPGEDERPYLCMFSMTFVEATNTTISNMAKADYLGLWPPWTTIPILIDDEELYVHVITKFMVDV
ncbi:uncharacterized protein BX664DRAFT_333349 [Halteromyces radiatus]|uniref:uncharacterized protein n=1 Tax=Halteromyces radiatus TaxID=101107 RepID=UPI00221F215A|nr:uncharacterized protein BX664DRAFT_333349 [Halteromyces radiatus]KAI8089565.1 hypothetical protein BX664DRAFT_333349 [Halteromyces radiatus]